jgi:cullin 1
MSNSQPPASVDLETTWAFLEEGIDHLMTNSLTGSVSYAKVCYYQLRPHIHFLSYISQHMSLTTAVFNYCSSSTRFGSVASGESSGRTKRREYGKYTSSRVGFLTIKKAAHGANLMGAELYKNLIQYFVTHLNGPRDVGFALYHSPSMLMRARYSKPNPCRTKRYCGTMRLSGLDTRMGHTASIVSSCI